MEYTIGSRVLDGWEIVQQIGAGSYGKVFQVKKSQYGIETSSALKVISIPESQADVRNALSDGMDEQSVTSYFKGFVDNLLHEIAIMSSVKSHPNIVSYEDHHLEEYPHEIRWDILIRMELLAPLNQYQQDKAREAGLPPGSMLPVSEVVRLGREISSALAFCQRKNIIHRDVKPENILISETGHFKLGDFGVAKTTSARSISGSHKGTDRYMAPEVFLDQPYGPTVDVYSLGLVMYRLLNNGRLPFLPPAPQPLTFGDYENAQMKRIRGEMFPPPAGADEKLAAIVQKACAFQSKDRWRSAGELQTALDEYAGSHITKYPQPSVQQGWKQEPQEEPPGGTRGGTVGVGWKQEPQEEPSGGTRGGTVGVGWKQEPQEEPPGGTRGGTVGVGWKQEPQEEPPGGTRGGTVGVGWKQEPQEEPSRGTRGGTVGVGWKQEPQEEPSGGTRGGTVGVGWRQEPQEEPSGGTRGGTVGVGWKQEPREEPSGGTRGGTVGGWWKDNDKMFQEALHKKQPQKAVAQKSMRSRDELVRFWKERIPYIAIHGQMRYCYATPDEIPLDLLMAAMERTQNHCDCEKVLAMISLRRDTKMSLFENGGTYGVKFWGLYVTETGFALLGKKKSNVVTNVICAKYQQIKDAKVVRDEQMGFHKLKLLLEGDKIVIFSPEFSSVDHYNYNVLCDALLEMRDRFR